MVKLLALAALLLFAAPESYVWNVPPGFPIPKVPADNPMSAAKVDLGRYLFYDKRLVKGATSYPASGTGIFEYTHDRADIGKFRVPTLRNIAVTAPYMHDGSARTLDDVLDHYAAGGRTIRKGHNAGAGSDNPNKSFFMQGFDFTAEERSDLIEFLRSLTDARVLTDPALSDPWK